MQAPRRNGEGRRNRGEERDRTFRPRARALLNIMHCACAPNAPSKLSGAAQWWMMMSSTISLVHVSLHLMADPTLICQAIHATIPVYTYIQSRAL